MVEPMKFVTPEQVQPGDVLVVQNKSSAGGRIIRDGAAIIGDPNSWDHVIIAHHTDAAGTFWGVEGRPGGVGWVDLGPRINDHWTISNHEQPKTAEQREQICIGAAGMLGVPYDWSAIAIDAISVIAPLWHRKDEWGPGVPGHIVCSSLADYLGERVGLATPKPDRFCTPADWAAFDLTHGWLS